MQLKITTMIQRIQTIYLALFIILNLLLILDFTILEFQGKGKNTVDPITLDISSQKLHLSGTLNLPEEAVDGFSESIKDTPISFDKSNQTLSMSKLSPLIFAQTLLLFLGLWTMFSFKKLAFQVRLARVTLILTFLFVAAIMVISYYTMTYLSPIVEKMELDEIIVTRHLEIGFFLSCALFPLIFLAQLGIKRDLNLIKSLDRLR